MLVAPLGRVALVYEHVWCLCRLSTGGIKAVAVDGLVGAVLASVDFRCRYCHKRGRNGGLCVLVALLERVALVY